MGQFAVELSAKFERVMDWTEGKVGAVTDGRRAMGQVRLRSIVAVGDPEHSWALLSFVGKAVGRSFVGADGMEVEVHSFRWYGTDGAPRFWSVCCECGHVVVLGMEDLESAAAGPCPGCAAALTGVRCARWHNWGHCLDCPTGGDAVMPPFAGLTRAADSPAPRKGPPQPSECLHLKNGLAQVPATF